MVLIHIWISFTAWRNSEAPNILTLAPCTYLCASLNTDPCCGVGKEKTDGVRDESVVRFPVRPTLWCDFRVSRRTRPVKTLQQRWISFWQLIEAHFCFKTMSMPDEMIFLDNVFYGSRQLHSQRIVLKIFEVLVILPGHCILLKLLSDLIPVI